MTPDTPALELLPETGAPAQLMILLHGVGSDADRMLPLGQALRARFPQAAVVVPRGFDAYDLGPAGRQWFSVREVTEDNRPARVAAVLARFTDWVQRTQARLQVEASATVLVGFSQGSIVALEAVQAHDGLAGRVIAFAGRYARLPDQAPQLTTLHLLHGGADPVIPARHAREALQHLGALQGDVTLDIAEGVGHEVHPALVDCALHRLTSHIPQRTWRAALGAGGA